MSHLAILDFWFRELSPAQWFRPGGTALDDMIRARFADQVEAALRGERESWAETPRGRLALILLLDQFTRNIFRGTAKAFAGDAKALALSLGGIEAGMDKNLTSPERHFFYMPLMHAEDPRLQALSVEKFTALKDEAAEILRFAEGHRAIIARFGRFPARNAALNRAPTPEEQEFLAAKKDGV